MAKSKNKRQWIKQWGKFSDTSTSVGSTKGFLSNSGSFLSNFRFDPSDINGVTSSTLLEISKSLAAHDRQICLTDEETDEEETDFEILQAAQSPTTPTKRKNSTPAQSPPIKSPRTSPLKRHSSIAFYIPPNNEEVQKEALRDRRAAFSESNKRRARQPTPPEEWFYPSLDFLGITGTEV